MLLSGDITLFWVISLEQALIAPPKYGQKAY
jgi:hypothetical protein